MRILHAAETIRGGVATVMRLNMEAQTTQFGAANVQALVPAEQSEDLSPIHSSQIHTFARTGRNAASFLGFLKAFHHAVRSFKPEVIHLHSTFAGVLGRAYLLASRILRPTYRPRIIYTPHAFAFLMEGSALKKRAYAGIERALLPITHAVICVSNFERTEALRHGLPGDKLHVIYNGVPDPGTPKRAKRKPGAPLELLFVGRLDYQKGFDILLEAMKQLESEPIHLTVIGDTVHGAEKPPARPNITYKGWLKPQELPTHYLSADVLVMPSRWEGFAMVPLEAMSYGLPILASNCTSLPEVVIPHQTGLLFNPETPNALTQTLKTTPPTHWQSLSASTYPHFQKNFVAQQTSNNTIKLY